jgi:uncharacterized protein YkwD
LPARADAPCVKALCAIVATALVGIPAALAGTSGRAATERSLETSVLRDINQIRVSHGAWPLRMNTRLSAAAAAHTHEMAQDGYFGHDSVDGSPFWRRVQGFYGSKGFRHWAVGENLVWASPDLTDRNVVDAWMESPEHRKNLLYPAWREIGLAVIHVPSAPGTYGEQEATIVTADFGVRRAS